MLHRLSPRDTTLVAFRGSIEVVEAAASGCTVAAVACGGDASASFCRGWLAAAVSGTWAGASACDCSVLVGCTASNATATACLEVSSVPSGNLDLNVSS